MLIGTGDMDLDLRLDGAMTIGDRERRECRELRGCLEDGTTIRTGDMDLDLRECTPLCSGR
jgi:hypothetical protein